MFYPNIAAELARRRMSKDMLAYKLGVSLRCIYNWKEKGEIPKWAVEKMESFFMCSADYLLVAEEDF